MSKARRPDQSGVNTQRGRPEAGAGNGNSEYIFAATLIATGLAMPWYFELPLNFDINAPDFNPLIFFPAILGGIGLVVLFRTVRATLQARSVGTAILATPTARVGAPYEAVIRTAIDVQAKGDFTGTLRCLRKARNSDDFESRSIEKTVWQQRVTAPMTSRSSQGVTLRFLIDPGLQRSGTKKEDGAHFRWVLIVTAPTRGLNFRAEFGVEVR